MRGPAVRPVVIAAGGTGGHLFPAEALAAEGIVKPLLILGLPDRFIDHENPKKQYDEAGLNAAQIVAMAASALGASAAARPARA